MRSRSIPLIAAPFLVALLLGGCAVSAPTSPGDVDDVETEESGAPETPELVEGEPAPPGTRVGFDVYLTYTFLTTDDEEALLSARLDSIEPATAEEMSVLVENFGDDIDGYDIYMLRMTGKKVSGAPVVYNADYAFFDVVDSAGERIQTVTLIGWDGCQNESFSQEYDDGAELAQCYMGAVRSGDAPPAGMAYTGGYEDGNPYDYLDGKPLLFIP